jgi:uncharacterized protein (TIGR03083 family)
VSDPDLAALYRDGHERFAGLVRELSEDELAAQVSACPGWRVRDVVAHLAGVAEDVATGNLAGAPGADWTAAQVQRSADSPVADLLDRWAGHVPAVAAMLAGNPRRWATPLDVATHEQDVRGAVGRPGARDNATISTLTGGLVGALDVPAPLLVRIADGDGTADDVRVGPDGGEPVVLTTTRFEAFRWRLGRRSRRQLAAMDWSGDPEPFLDHLYVFGPSPTDIVE